VDDNDDLKGVICDLDGTLYRQKPVRLHMFFALLGHYVAHIDKLQQLYGIYLFRKIREREDFRQTSYSSQIEYVSEKVKLGKEELDNVIQYWMFEYPLRWVGRYADNYLISKLKEVQDRGVKVIIYSDYPADDKLEVLGIKPDYVFYPGISGIDSLKPSKEAMDLIVREVGIASGELVYIGDRQEKDGVSAQLVGISFALV
jgi:FMN phosphatase YigB (HAD superfamily)